MTPFSGRKKVEITRADVEKAWIYVPGVGPRRMMDMTLEELGLLAEKYMSEAAKDHERVEENLRSRLDHVRALERQRRSLDEA